MGTLHEITDAVLRPVGRYLVMSLGRLMLQHLLLEQRGSANNASRQSLRREGGAEPKELERRLTPVGDRLAADDNDRIYNAASLSSQGSVGISHILFCAFC